MAKNSARFMSERNGFSAWLCNLPLVLLTGIFILIPVAGTLLTSLLRDVTFLPQAFAGLQNYRRLFADAHFWQSMRFTLVFVFTSVALLFRTIDAIRIFDLIYVLTGGGPGGATTSLSLYAFRYYVSGDFGYGSCISLVVFLLAGLLAVGYLRVGRFAEVLR